MGKRTTTTEVVETGGGSRWLGVALVVVVVGAVLALAARWRGEARSAGLVADSLAAVADSATREVTALAGLGDTVRAWQRRALQTERERDALDRRLRLETAARSTAEVALRAVRDSVTAETTADTADVRTGRFSLHQEPVSVSVEVRMPPPPAPGVAVIEATVDPIPLAVRVGCRDAEPARSAWVTWTGPEWVQVDLRDVQADPDACNPPASIGVTSRSDVAAWPFVATGALAAFAPRGRVFDGLAGGALGWGVHWLWDKVPALFR